MAETTSETNNFTDNMIGAFFGNVSQRVFGNFGKQIDGLESKFKQLESSAKSPFQAMRAGAEKVESALSGVNKQLDAQADRIRKMPKMPEPPRQPTGRSPRQDNRDPETGRYIPRRRGWGDGGTRFGSRFSPGGGMGGISAFGGLGSVGLLFGGASAARGFGQFDANIHTLLAEAGPDINQVGGKKGLMQSILDISGSTQFSSGETAEMLIAMVKDGVKLQDAIANIPNVLKLAVAESTDLTTAWQTTNTFVSGLNVPLSESVRLMDMMSNATSLSKLKLENIQYIAGQSLSLYKEIAAFSEEGFLGISGILGPLFRPERIGTGLKQLSLLLPQAASGQLAGSKNKVFESWGVNIADAAGNLKDEVSVLKEFERVFAGMSGEARNVELAKVFGTEAAPVFSALIGKSAKLAENMQAIRKKGTLDEKFEVHAKSLTNQFKLLTSAGDSLIKKFMMILNEGNAFGGGIGWVTEKITQLTGFMESNKDAIQAWWGNFKEILGGLFNLVETGVEKFMNFWSGLSDGQKTILAISGVILTFLANPVAGIIAAGGLIIAKWQPIKSFFVSLFNDITWTAFEAHDAITERWGKIQAWFSGVWVSIKDKAKIAWGEITEFFSDAWSKITSPALKAVGFIQNIWGSLPDKIKEPLQSVFDSISKRWGAFTEELKAPFEVAFNWIAEKFDWLKTKVIETLNFLPGVEIGGGALVEDKKKSALPKLERLPGESDQMYKFRRMQERDNLNRAMADVSQFRTIGETEKTQNKAREQAIKRQRRLRAGTTALGGFEMFEKYTKNLNATPSVESKNQDAKTHYETRAAKPVTGTVPEPMKVPEHLRPGRAQNRNFLPNLMTGVNETMAFLYQQQDDMKRQQMMAGSATNRTSMPYLPSLTGFGDALVKQILDQGDIQLYAEMMSADRERRKPTPEGLFGTPKKQLPTADPTKAFEGLQATKVISFPKLDDAQYAEMSGMFRDGFISLVDVSSAILSEMQTQTQLMGGTPDMQSTVIRPIAGSGVDEMVANRLAGIQQLNTPVVQPNLEDSAAPHVPVITPETRPAFEELLENRLRLADRVDTEHGRVTAEGQRVEIGGQQTSGQGNITIEKIEIHADSEMSGREIAQEVLKEFANMLRKRNF